MKFRPVSAVGSSVIVCLSSCAYVPNPQAPAKSRDAAVRERPVGSAARDATSGIAFKLN
jgi:hypothetical protein